MVKEGARRSSGCWPHGSWAEDASGCRLPLGEIVEAKEWKQLDALRRERPFPLIVGPVHNHQAMSHDQVLLSGRVCGF